ncbi:MAG: deoxyribonuclease V [Planctomycetota bacterium]|jgi:deoxyribonuclease V
MRISKLHSWNLSYAEARDLQTRLACEVQFAALKKPPKLIAGLDCAFSKDGKRIIAAVVVLKNSNTQKGLWEPLAAPGFEIVETTNSIQEVSFPYIPGLLSFREAPVCIAAVEKLKNEPDVFIVDGQGIAHPRRLGLAAHLGLFFDKPTIGCAKSRLTGTFDEPPPEKGAHNPLKDKNEVIGAVVRTRSNVEPVFVSVGNKCLLKDAIKVTLDCTTKYRIPEPTRLAHQLVSKLRLNA